MKLLIGYLIISISLLLVFSTGLVVQTGMALVPVPFDAISYYYIFFNFAVVGVLAVFYQKGIPKFVAQGYLVIISITMCWIFVRFLPDWTLWILLGVLALYDLCAVLTPCGPLKLLVNIMQDRPQNEQIPALLYEARVQNTNNITRNRVTNNVSSSTSSAPSRPPPIPASSTKPVINHTVSTREEQQQQNVQTNVELNRDVENQTVRANATTRPTRH